MSDEERKRREPCERCGKKRYLKFWWSEELCTECIMDEVESSDLSDEG